MGTSMKKAVFPESVVEGLNRITDGKPMLEEMLHAKATP
ncbi:putative Protein MLO [Corchorus olitorius]|uniref:Uncharacterized protein n=1 Tax=Corchorus olitorius TaxID=93759 RepID=A0A1R3GZ93_9ROSI|nr:putative Protein MLO [Corchorus olitorius]